MIGNAVAILVRRLEGCVPVLGPCEREAVRAGLILARALELPAVAVCAGSAEPHDRALEVALRAGCDRALRVDVAPELAGDYLAVAELLAAAADHLGARLVVCGDRAQDGGRGAIGPAVAELLGVAHFSGVLAVEPIARPEAVGRFRCRCRAQSEVAEIECSLPAVLCVRSAGGPRPGRGKPRARGPIEVLDATIDESAEVDQPAAGDRRGESAPIHYQRTVMLAASPAELVDRLRRDHVIES